MNCPKCGAPIRAGSLYCEQCGEDVHIVPDFEPELEETYRKTIEGITQSIWTEEPKPEEEEKPQTETPGNSWIPVILFAVLFVLFTVLAVGLILYERSANSEESIQQQAEIAVATADYEKAIRLYEQLTEDNPEDISLKLRLSRIYLESGNEVLYENLLWEIVKDPNTDEEQLTTCYEQILSLYYDLQDYASIADILEICDNEELQSRYWFYRKPVTEFDVESGYYELSQLVRISTETEGEIYYTLNGGEETLYTMPLFLEEGDYTLSAYGVNRYGVAGDVAEAEYHIEEQKLVPPTVMPYSGDFMDPTLIYVEDADLEVSNGTAQIYYTTDGSDPDRDDILYTHPIPMPLGETEYRFICISQDGSVSDVVSVQYDLDPINAQVTLDEAASILAETKGSWDGSISFGYLYPVRVMGRGDFYAFAGYTRTEAGWEANGLYYAVNYYDRSVWDLAIDGSDFSIILPEDETSPDSSGE